METPDLITICLTSFVAVLLLLSFLALVMRIIILIFPAKDNDDSAVIAAITSTYNVHFPGTKIIKIGEQK
ncbi:MAG: hypothetical protein WBG58_13155 [Ignavibacteriaceae bacterium]